MPRLCPSVFLYCYLEVKLIVSPIPKETNKCDQSLPLLSPAGRRPVVARKMEGIPTCICVVIHQSSRFLPPSSFRNGSLGSCRNGACRFDPIGNLTRAFRWQQGGRRVRKMEKARNGGVKGKNKGDRGIFATDTLIGVWRCG